jgi:hypothetical protein
LPTFTIGQVDLRSIKFEALPGSEARALLPGHKLAFSQEKKRVKGSKRD